jgi:hypothetical protein
MSEPALRPWTVEEFLAWEREQPERWEFDGVQPVPRAMVGGLRPHVRLSARLLIDLAASLPAECEAYGAERPSRTWGCGGWAPASLGQDHAAAERWARLSFRKSA